MNPQSLTLHIYTQCASSLLPSSARKDISRLRTSCALHSGIPTSHLPEDQHLSRISATPFHGFVSTTDGSLASLMPGTGFSWVLLCRSVCTHDDSSKVAAAVEEPVWIEDLLRRRLLRGEKHRRSHWRTHKAMSIGRRKSEAEHICFRRAEENRIADASVYTAKLPCKSVHQIPS